MPKILPVPVAFIAVCLCVCITTGCANKREALTAQQAAAVKTSVGQLADSIAANITSKGPAEWLVYFKNAPEFFMASGGAMAFANYDSARGFIQNILVKNTGHIALRWSNTRIDPLTETLASLAANFHEDITDTAGKATPYDGYFTAIAEQTADGWKLRNVHWSLMGK